MTYRTPWGLLLEDWVEARISDEEFVVRADQMLKGSRARRLIEADIKDAT